MINYQHESALLTDLCELTMLQAYFSRSMNDTAAFEFFVRDLPNERNFLLAFDGTATTLAAPLFEIPVFGTMAHSFIQTHERESEAFTTFARAFPDNATLLIDTYDTEAGAQQVVRLAKQLGAEDGIHIKAVRIDSGDLGTLARRVRQILNAGGCSGIGIFASGNLDEYALQSLRESGAPIDGFGVGTRMNTSSDAPYLDCGYKLVEYAGEARRKLSSGKATWPSCKQVLRHCDTHGAMCSDTLTLQEDAAAGEAQLQPIMRGDALLRPLPQLPDIRVTTHFVFQLKNSQKPMPGLRGNEPIAEHMWKTNCRSVE